MSFSRWPVHPEPITGEALSSWLRRIGRIYGCSVPDLLKYDLGFPEIKTRGLDVEAPAALLVAIEARTGLPVKAIERITFAGSVPFLFKRPFTDPVKTDVEYCSVLFEPPDPPPGSLSKLREWFRKEYISKINGCRQCLADYPNRAILLGWGLKVVLSCPIHGVMLESARINGEGLDWVKEKEEAAPELVCQLDRRSLEAVAEGCVQLQGGLVSAAQWFRMLQSIFHELNAPLFSVERGRLKWQSQLWKAADYFPPGPFETFKFDKSCALLIAMAIDLMEKGEVIPTGRDGLVFCEYDRSDEKVGLLLSTSELNSKMCKKERRAGREAVPLTPEVLELIW